MPRSAGNSNARPGPVEGEAGSCAERPLSAADDWSSLAGAAFRSITEGTDDAVVCCTKEGRILTWNGGARRLFGYSAGEAVGLQFVTLVAPKEVAATCDFLLRAAEGRGGRRDTVVLQKDGWTVEASLTLSPIRKHDRGPAVAICSIVRDVSAGKQAHLELTTSRDRLRLLAAHVEDLREQERTRLAREIHDELSQMLTVLRMEIEAAAELVKNGSPTTSIIHRLDLATKHLQRSISAAKKISADLRPGVLDHLGLAAALEWQGREFESRTGITCSIPELPVDIPIEPARATAIFRIFQGILTNVALHSGAAQVAVDVHTESGELVLEVRDNGHGIPEGKLEDFGSLGIFGMREKASLLGGAVEFVSRPEKGTKVTLRVPFTRVRDAIQEPVQQPGRETSEEGTSIRPVRILIVDDHTIFRQGLKEYLGERLEATCEEAGTAEAAEDLIRTHPWNLVILDISMPGKSGLELLQELRAEGSQVPVLVVSTHSDEHYRKIVLKSGGNGYVCKSQPTEDLVAGIRKVLAGGSCFSEVVLRVERASSSE